MLSMFERSLGHDAYIYQQVCILYIFQELLHTVLYFHERKNHILASDSPCLKRSFINLVARTIGQARWRTCPDFKFGHSHSFGQLKSVKPQHQSLSTSQSIARMREILAFVESLAFSNFCLPHLINQLRVSYASGGQTAGALTLRRTT